ncbi:DinB family protein [Pollutibacter soli]|uniref:DinB family protein n=1 Tax=Pollutibacter soli TaxID=3034157 RepID=UPI0030135476
MKTEVWQRGPIEGIPALLQPVAHALLQAAEEVEELMQHFPAEMLWNKLYHSASPGFHLLHMSGVIDRLFTYARNEKLNETQMLYLQHETLANKDLDTNHLVAQFSDTVRKAIEQLRSTPEDKLTEFRGLGRKQLPTTVIGLLFHSAEHIMRHMGQLLVTMKTAKEIYDNKKPQNLDY